MKTNLLEIVGQVRRHLEYNGRVSLRMLRRQLLIIMCLTGMESQR